MNTTTLDLTADIIDVRDIIDRIETIELELTGDEFPTDEELALIEELAALTAIMDDLEGSGGDEQWRGAWYPVTLIADVHFTQYAEDLAYEIGAIPANTTWPNNCIDWDQAAYELRHDYTSVEIGKFTYYYR